jgi:tRNA G18 (ribose-2'-O)-methylase SpoU
MRVICCGTAKIIDKIARDSVDEGRAPDVGSDDATSGVEIHVHRTLAPALVQLKRDGYRLVGLEQTTGSQSLYTFPFERRTVLVVGNERQGLEDDILRLLDAVVEIPVYGPPRAHNAATATAIALYEFCRQYPCG